MPQRAHLRQRLGNNSDLTKLVLAKLLLPAISPPSSAQQSRRALRTNVSIGAGNTCTPCPDGGHSLPGSSACEWCLNAKYYNKIANTREACPHGKYTDTGKNDFNDCKSCDPGFYSNEPEGAGYCPPCPAGNYANPSKTVCPVCPSGKFSGIAATNCTECESGKYNNVEGSSVCKPCPNYMTSEPGPSRATARTLSSPQ